MSNANVKPKKPMEIYHYYGDDFKGIMGSPGFGVGAALRFGLGVHALLIKISFPYSGPEENKRIEEIAKAFNGREAIQINYSFNEKEKVVGVCVMSSNTTTQFSTNFKLAEARILSCNDRKPLTQ